MPHASKPKVGLTGNSASFSEEHLLQEAVLNLLTAAEMTLGELAL